MYISYYSSWRLKNIDHHLLTHQEDTCYVDCHTLQQGMVRKQECMVVHVFYKSIVVSCKQWRCYSK